MSIEQAKTRKASRGQLSHEATLEKGFEAIKGLAELLRFDIERATSKAGLSQPMAVALSRVGRLPDQATASELARSLGCNMGNLSGTLDRLEEAGFVERIPCEGDRRIRFIRLTMKGRRMLGQMTESFLSGRVCTALKQMDDEQLGDLTDTIDRLNRTAKAEASN